MQNIESTKRTIPNWRELGAAWLRSPRALIITGIVVVAAGMALGWRWLSAVGIAPVILSLAPCAAMCALGACAMMKGAASCASPNPNKTADPSGPASAPRQSAEESDR
jgi:hypothetical protein